RGEHRPVPELSPHPPPDRAGHGASDAGGREGQLPAGGYDIETKPTQNRDAPACPEGVLLLERSGGCIGSRKGEGSGDLDCPPLYGGHMAGGVVEESVFCLSLRAYGGVGLLAVGSLLSTSAAQGGQILWLVSPGTAL